MSTSPVAASDRSAALRLLRWVNVVAFVDFLLLVPLVVGMILDRHDLAPIIGPIHGFGFLLEVFLAVRGAGERWWGWWYPAAIVLTGGPLGALLGHRRARREAETAGRVAA